MSIPRFIGLYKMDLNGHRIEIVFSPFEDIIYPGTSIAKRLFKGAFLRVYHCPAM